MAQFQEVVNPAAANMTVADYRTMKDSSGQAIPVGKTNREYLIAATVAVGDVVCLVAATSATVPMGVTPKVTARKFTSVVGVVERGGAAGAVASVVTEGLAFVNVGAGAPAAGDNATIQGNSAQAGVVTTESDASTITGTILGTFLGTKDANNLAPVFINRQ